MVTASYQQSMVSIYLHNTPVQENLQQTTTTPANTTAATLSYTINGDHSSFSNS